MFAVLDTVRRARLFVFVALLLVLTALLVLRRAPQVTAQSATSPAALPAGARAEQLKRAYSRLPMSFEVNRGQASEEVKFLARGHGYQVFLTDTEAALVLHTTKCAAPGEACQRSASLLPTTAADPTTVAEFDPANRRADLLRFKVEGAETKNVTGLDLLPTKSNYLIGNDPAQWQRELPNYARVSYGQVRPGVDLAFYGTQRALEYDFIVAPGVDPAQITMSIEGAEQIEADENGDLVLHVGGQRVLHRAPVSYQTVSGKQQSVRSRYVVKGGNRIGFEVENYDRARQLTIDPIIDFSTFFGGVGSDEGFAIAVDAAGNAYVTGTTYSNNFNTFAPLQTINRGGKYDAFVTKINAAGSSIVYSTYLGGSAEDSGHGIAVNQAGQAFIAGITNSPDFNTRNPLQATIVGLTEDAFITKINADGTDLLFSTYLGGSNIDQAFAIALDGAGDAYVTGSTASGDFKTKNPFQATKRAGFDAFLTKIKGDGSQLIYSTFFGGNALDEAYGVAVDTFGSAYITGQTASTDFTTFSAFQLSNNGGGSDAFVARFNSTGTNLVFSTYLGGSGVDVAYGIAVDGNSNAYITGHTFSTNFPVSNPLQANNRGNADAFITRLSAQGDTLVYSTYLGGTGGDFGRGIAVDGSAQAYVTGRTVSTDFNTRNPLQAALRGNFDAFVAKVDFSGSQLIYSTYLGGAEDDLGLGITIDLAGNAYVTGDTRSLDFNTSNPLQNSNRGGLDAFVSKLNPAGSQLVYSTYLGGSGEDLAQGIALDPNGNAYITGFTSSNDYPTQGGIQAVNRGGLESFVTKVVADASSIAFNTYFGGNGSDTANAIAVDSSGNAYVTGGTTSTNLPTVNALQATNRGGLDAFVVKFNSAGSALVYSTYLGGTFGDFGRGIAVDQSGNAYLTGSTFSTDFPVQNPFQATNRGLGDAFVTKLNAAGTAITYSSYLGGAGTDEGVGLAVDSSGSAYVVGSTLSGDFNTKNPVQATNRGQQDAFVSKVAADGGQLVYSTYLGGTRADLANGVALDLANNAYVIGSTASTNFPTQTPLQSTYGGGDFDAFITRLNASGTALVYSTYLGGALADVGNGIAVDPFGNAYVTGATNSLNFPLKNPIQSDNRGGSDAFISKLAPSGTSLTYSTYLGGSSDDRGAGIAVDSVGTAYVAGSTGSRNFNIQFPLVPYGGGTDVFVAKIISEPSIALGPASLEVQSGGSATMTVTLSAPLNQPVTVTLTSSNPAVLQVPATVTISAGSLSADFTVFGVTAGGPITVTAALPASQGGATATATANVTTTSRVVQIGSTAAAGGSIATVPIELVAQGNENRLTFSLALNQSILLTPNFVLGADADNATLTLNTSQAAQGRYGIIIALPGGQTFAAGTRQVLVLSAFVISGSNATSTAITFADSPTVRRVIDTNNQPLVTTYTPGTITLAQGVEGDVSPRPTGSDGTVTVADWVQTGRFAAGIDTAAAGGEFQRADTAPRATLGNGVITVADWVQVGRYWNSFDPVVAAGGPTAPTGFAGGEVQAALRARGVGKLANSVGTDEPFAFAPPLAGRTLATFLPLLPEALQQQTRVIRASNLTAQRGQQVTINIDLDAQGNENALGFSLIFDPAQLTYVTTTNGADVGAAQVNVNNNQASSGRLGFALALPTGQSFAAGTRRLLALTFTVLANSTANNIALGFGDQPVAREVVNPNADTLTTAYAPGSIVIGREVTAVSAASFAGGQLASEQIVAAFGTSLATATQVATTVPLPTTLVGTTVNVRDSQGTSRPAPLFFVAPTQVNFQIPPGTAVGAATITVTSGDGAASLGAITITAVAPGLFTAASNGQGLAAAFVLRVKADGSQTTEPIGQFDVAQQRFVAIPIDLGPATDQVFLVAFGTGLRGRSALTAVTLTIGGVAAEVAYLGPQGTFVGLDQGNFRIPRTLIGRGEVDAVLTVDGKAANTVRVAIK